MGDRADFNETLDLARRAARKYGATLHTFQPPEVATPAEFEARYGAELWKADEASYDYLVKVEPSQRAYAALNVGAVITGRRRSQGGDRAAIPALERDETGLIKVNPLAAWTFKDTKAYIDAHAVPYNALLDQGYKSIGDWHSTQPADPSLAGDAGERAGRWAGRADKTECGLHKDYFKQQVRRLVSPKSVPALTRARTGRLQKATTRARAGRARRGARRQGAVVVRLLRRGRSASGVHKSLGLSSLPRGRLVV
jgi:phosphoadenylyl-sulfate reductase (thioredoxin)